MPAMNPVNIDILRKIKAIGIELGFYVGVPEGLEAPLSLCIKSPYCSNGQCGELWFTCDSFGYKYTVYSESIYVPMDDTCRKISIIHPNYSIISNGNDKYGLVQNIDLDKFRKAAVDILSQVATMEQEIAADQIKLSQQILTSVLSCD